MNLEWTDADDRARAKHEDRLLRKLQIVKLNAMYASRCHERAIREDAEEFIRDISELLRHL